MAMDFSKNTLYGSAMKIGLHDFALNYLLPLFANFVFLCYQCWGVFRQIMYIHVDFIHNSYEIPSSRGNRLKIRNYYHAYISELKNVCQVYFLECGPQIWVMHYMGPRLFMWPIVSMIVRIFVLHLIVLIISDILIICQLFWARSWNNGMRFMSFYIRILLKVIFENIFK